MLEVYVEVDAVCDNCGERQRISEGMDWRTVITSRGDAKKTLKLNGWKSDGTKDFVFGSMTKWFCKNCN